MSRACTSFIGVDGTNSTLEHRPLSHRPEAVRSAQSVRQPDHPPAQAGNRPRRRGIALYMQPVQDLTIDASVTPRAISIRA